MRAGFRNCPSRTATRWPPAQHRGDAKDFHANPCPSLHGGPFLLGELPQCPGRIAQRFRTGQKAGFRGGDQAGLPHALPGIRLLFQFVADEQQARSKGGIVVISCQCRQRAGDGPAMLLDHTQLCQQFREVAASTSDRRVEPGCRSAESDRAGRMQSTTRRRQPQHQHRANTWPALAAIAVTHC